MKIVILILVFSSSIFSQEYEKGKIDMHGGKFESYKRVDSYKNNSFSKPVDLSKLLDINSTKNIKKSTPKM